LTFNYLYDKIKVDMTEENKVKETGFYLKKAINLNDAAFIPESDLAIQNGEHLLQYEYKRNESQRSIVIKPGIYNLTKTSLGLDIVLMEFVQRELLTSIINTSKILNEANTFFNNLNIYEELKQPKKRGVLLYGSPGQGKSVSIIQAANDIKKDDPNAVVINWPTAEIDASGVFKFFTSYSQYAPECSKLILVIEDIGGGSHEGYSRRDEVSSSLLNLLDGINNVFKIPTLILATTNHIENLMASIADRPGRFDLALEIKSPGYDERVQLVEFLAKRPLTEEEKDSLNGKNNPGAEEFSIAHLQEIVIRSRLHLKSIDSVVKELIAHKKAFKVDFSKPKKRPGFLLMDDLDD
jgi:SpoVK/Ycf46/Vps4 family AAA+-type ATPase